MLLKLSSARCSVRSVWFRFQNDANLYLGLPAVPKRQNDAGTKTQNPSTWFDTSCMLLKTKNKQIYQIVSQTLQALLVICRLGNILHDALKDEDADLCFQFNVMEHNERRKFTINTSQRRHSLTSRTWPQDNVYGRVDDCMLAPLHLWIPRPPKTFQLSQTEKKTQQHKQRIFA